jgi:hypothetical protein
MWMTSGVANGPMAWRTCLERSLELADGSRSGSNSADQRDVGVDALALDVVREADHGGFRDGLVFVDRAFDFGRAEAVAGDVQHVVDAAGDPVITVLVAPAAVAGEVFTACTGEIGLS